MRWIAIRGRLCNHRAPTMLHVPARQQGDRSRTAGAGGERDGPGLGQRAELANLVRERNSDRRGRAELSIQPNGANVARAISGFDMLRVIPGKVHLLSYSQHRVRPNPRTLTLSVRIGVGHVLSPLRQHAFLARPDQRDDCIQLAGGLVGLQARQQHLRARSCSKTARRSLHPYARRGPFIRWRSRSTASAGRSS